ncbi:uncharacterized protein Gasu_50910 [Galdieria sulphuraria]|uniref:Uncharacterized protein n=1 Tax=Galdieria sulphuraria TaxID=130081 RepID=M2XBV9_GALSU|nr:uncharacterized protein Gasu_50910 [Galdieria sulphuraria]EME27362.1 hypothetical protein Gasu_50910 [Galdieria sulphuraria]|eukprot:XP_005703882.1 hypothetical protein Gasu_50910 [Galdieria sulphuraria]
MRLSPAKRMDITPSKLGTPSRVRAFDSDTNKNAPFSPISQLHTPRRILGGKPSEAKMENDEHNSQGSKITLSAVKASPRQKKELGSDTILSPVRYSTRIKQKREGNVSTPDSNRVKQYLQQSGYTYAPNKYVKEGFHLESNEFLKNKEENAETSNP